MKKIKIKIKKKTKVLKIKKKRDKYQMISKVKTLKKIKSTN